MPLVLAAHEDPVSALGAPVVPASVALLLVGEESFVRLLGRGGNRYLGGADEVAQYVVEARSHTDCGERSLYALDDRALFRIHPERETLQCHEAVISRQMISRKPTGRKVISGHMFGE